MILILEIISPKTPGAGRFTFHEDGGSIGRDKNNSWVLPHSKVSGIHAAISHRSGVYYIEDRSRNGVFLNSSKNRLERGRPQPIKIGDRILIDPYEIRVSITRERGERTDETAGASSAGRPASPAFGGSNPLDVDDPFAPLQAGSSPLAFPEMDDAGNQELDPLELLNLASKRPPRRKTPRAGDLERGSLLDGHYKPPAVMPTPSFGSDENSTSIPEDYDPLAPDEILPIPSAAAPPPPEPRAASRRRDERTAHVPVDAIGRSLPPQVSPPARESVSEPEGSRAGETVNFGAVLAGAGLNPASITPEVAREFGQILRVVVSGVMDVMRSRQQIKDEFRMQGTRVKRVDNNPLKFSANVEDALHNLLMKRNRAYMSPVEAFEDAFADLRHHQIAMLAGMRTAFESMRAEFDPDRLQQEFDRQLAKGLVPAKLRYWDLYRERQQEADRDPEATFRHLFGEEFARAYEEQLKALKARERQAGSDGPIASQPPET